MSPIAGSGMLKKTTVAAGAAFILVVAGTVAWELGLIDEFVDHSNGAIKACEQGVISQLRSPTSYKRIDVAFTLAPALSFEEFKEYRKNQGCPFSPDEDSCKFGNFTTHGYQVNLALAGKLNDPASLIDINRRDFSRKRIKAANEEADRWDFDETSKAVAGSPNTSFVTINYDAMNSMGVSLRSSATCRFGPALPGRKWTKADIFVGGSTRS